jgi:hypothetical protein
MGQGGFGGRYETGMSSSLARMSAATTGASSRISRSLSSGAHSRDPLAYPGCRVTTPWR